MSPEVLAGTGACPEADQYALGIALCCMVHGKAHLVPSAVDDFCEMRGLVSPSRACFTLACAQA